MQTSTRRFVAALLVVTAAAVFSPRGYSQNLSSTVTMQLDLANFGIHLLNPAPSASSTSSTGVFAWGPTHTMPIIIRQWSNGTMSVETSSRYQTRNETTGSLEQTTVGGNVVFTFSTPGAQVGATLTLQETAGTSFSTSLAISNSISYTVENNLLKAQITWTEGGVTRHVTIDLGTFTDEGGFRALPGKEDIISGYENFAVIPGYEPARFNGNRGRTGTADPVYADVLVGYWVTTGTVNGQIVSVTFDPVYVTRLVGFQQYVDPYSAPGGGGMLK